VATVIRLTRLGTKRKPHHKIVVTDRHRPRDGRFIEQLGIYDPSKKPALVTVNADRARYWLSVGAQPTPTVKSLFKQQKVTPAVVTPPKAAKAPEAKKAPAKAKAKEK